MFDWFMQSFPDAQPLHGLAGGVLIGLAGAVMLLGPGRIAGISGMTARVAGLSGGAPWPLAALFLAGLPAGALAVAALMYRAGIRLPVPSPDEAESTFCCSPQPESACCPREVR